MDELILALSIPKAVIKKRLCNLMGAFFELNGIGGLALKSKINLLTFAFNAKYKEQLKDSNANHSSQTKTTTTMGSFFLSSKKEKHESFKALTKEGYTFCSSINTSQSTGLKFSRAELKRWGDSIPDEIFDGTMNANENSHVYLVHTKLVEPSACQTIIDQHKWYGKLNWIAAGLKSNRCRLLSF